MAPSPFRGGTERSPAWRLCILLLGMVCTGFSTGYQPIAVAGWLQFLLMVLFLDSKPAASRTWRDWVALWLAQGVGFAFAFAGSFNNPGWKASQVLVVGAGALAGQAVLVLGCLGTWERFACRWPHSTHRRILALPVLVTGAWMLISKLSPTGAYGHPAYSQWTLPPVVQLASVTGVSGICFLLAWFGSAVGAALTFDCQHGRERGPPRGAGLEELEVEEPSRGSPLLMLGGHGMGSTSCTHHHHQHHTVDGERPASEWRELRKHLWWLAAVVLAVLWVGGANMTVLTGELFYQKTVEQTRGSRPTARMSCIISQDVTMGQGDQQLWEQTTARAMEGNSLVMWSEEAMTLFGSDQEAALLARAANLSRSSGAWLGLAYELYASPSAREGKDLAENVFTLVRPEDGSTALRYLKTHPVPLVESNVVAGRGREPPVLHHTPFGTISAAICFDLDFPDWVRGAGRAGVDLMLQPSWTWGPIGPLHAYDNAFRAVENGFTLFRCSSGGVSGVFTSQYGFESVKFTGRTSGGIDSVAVPLDRHRPTLFPWGGFVFGWVCVALSAVYVLAVLLPQSWLPHSSCCLVQLPPEVPGSGSACGCCCGVQRGAPPPGYMAGLMAASPPPLTSPSAQAEEGRGPTTTDYKSCQAISHPKGSSSSGQPTS